MHEIERVSEVTFGDWVSASMVVDFLTGGERQRDWSERETERVVWSERVLCGRVS